MQSLDILAKSYAVPVETLKREYSSFSDFKLVMLTAASFGSGVSELVCTLQKYFTELGLNSSWLAVKADKEFFILSKKITDALSLSLHNVSHRDLERFKELSLSLQIPSEADVLYLHDFHALIAASHIKNAKKIYRCHFDISRANMEVWTFLKPYIEACDEIIFTSPECHRPLNKKADYILPSIDPCCVKNTVVAKKDYLKVLNCFNIASNKPLILQVSRFDRVKDPFGLIDVFREVRKDYPCTLVYAGGFAPDDINAAALYEELKQYSKGEKDIILLSINRRDYEISALQSAADVIVQKSFSESFGLSITEALWKTKPVAASDVGGIRKQIINNKTGLLCKDKESFTAAVLRLLQDKSLSLRLAENGHNFVKEKFLITRELKEHTEIFKKIV